MTFFLLLLAGLAGGGANALAGGGTFLVFPALLFAGVASVKANATASLIMAPGGIASTFVYRRTLTAQPFRLIAQLAAASLAGSLAGSLLLLNTPNATFSSLIPWLLLLAAIVFTATPLLRGMVRDFSGRRSTVLLLSGQFIISVYGGYFGAGMGVLMIALYLVATSLTVQSAGGLRILCATIVNVLAVVLFAWRGAIDWKLGPPMLIAGVAGGYFGARLVQYLSERAVRRAILIYAWALTAYFFARKFWL